MQQQQQQLQYIKNIVPKYLQTQDSTIASKISGKAIVVQGKAVDRAKSGMVLYYL